MHFLLNKNILLISPQPWDHIFISKHHYAEELIKYNNIVFFLEPPLKSGLPGIYIRKHETLKNLFIVSWRSYIPKIFRFHFYPIYKRLIAIQARIILKKLNVSLNVVWSFDFNVFPDLKKFDSQFSIFHPVDPLSERRQITIGESADLIISVSEKILANFSDSKSFKHKMLINHGLSGSFHKLSQSFQIIDEPHSKSVKVGYFGNLDRKVMNQLIWNQIISENPTVKFHFWGPYDQTGSFYRNMTHYGNTIFHGKKEKNILVTEIKSMDCFLLIYSQDNVESDRSNSHKILEYLATGKVVISSRIESYLEFPELVLMPGDGDDGKLPKIFSDTIASLIRVNSSELMNARKKHAEMYSYKSNLEKIDQYICQSLLNGESCSK